ncbi:hypothetical protein BC828DRAFT_379743 [Blastocladiella britannica]|nr:hypothetical protein BC828DRAFT_379743 [Blastocladiella britannica]
MPVIVALLACILLPLLFPMIQRRMQAQREAENRLPADTRKQLTALTYVAAPPSDTVPEASALICEDSGDALCAICLVEYSDGDKCVKLPCNHHYHFDCLGGWLDVARVCPVCRADVHERIAGAAEVEVV